MADEQPPALTTEDYQALHAMQISDDPSQRSQAADLANKLTGDERKAFFDYQQSANAGKGERTREDGSLFGMPPELAVVSGLSVGRAIGAAGLTAAGRAIAGLKATAAQVTPQLKYAAAQEAMNAIGVPKRYSIPAALIIAGLKNPKGGAAAEAEATPTGPHMDRSIPVRPSELTQEQLKQRIFQGYGTPPAAEVRQQAVAGARLNAQRAAAAQAQVAAPVAAPEPGAPVAAAPSPIDARPSFNVIRNAQGNISHLEKISSAAQTAPETAITAPPAATFKPGVSGKFTAAEAWQSMKWKAAGVSDAQILERIEASRAFNAAAGLTPPTVAQTKFPKGMRGGLPK